MLTSMDFLRTKELFFLTRWSRDTRLLMPQKELRKMKKKRRKISQQRRRRNLKKSRMPKKTVDAPLKKLWQCWGMNLVIGNTATLSRCWLLWRLLLQTLNSVFFCFFLNLLSCLIIICLLSRWKFFYFSSCFLKYLIPKVFTVHLVLPQVNQLWLVLLSFLETFLLHAKWYDRLTSWSCSVNWNALFINVSPFFFFYSGDQFAYGILVSSLWVSSRLFCNNLGIF